MSVNGAEQRKDVRIPFATSVEVRFEEFDEFVSQFSENLSLSGMFLRTTRPHPEGSNLEFEFEVSTGQPLIRGVGEVVWTRERQAGGPPGMGVRFLSLDSQSRKLIRWLLDRSLRRGGSTFEL